MLKDISHTVDSLAPSPIRAMFDIAAGMQNPVSFILGEPDFDTPPNIVQAAMRALQGGQTHYTSNAGILALREAIAENLRREQGIVANPATEIIVAAGATEMLCMIFRTLIDPGDEIIVQDPLWPTCIAQIKLCGGKAVPVRLHERDGFVLLAKAVKRVVTDRTKAIVINTPQNPTGAVIPQTELVAIAKVAEKHGLYIIADEVYRKIIYGGAKHFSIASLPEFRLRTITVDSFSKTYAMTGWRVGYAVANPELVERMTKMHEFYSSCVNTSAQFGAIEALQGPQEPLEEMLNQYRLRREVVAGQIRAMDKLSCTLPSGAFYLFINIRQTGLSSQEFAYRLLREQGVCVAPGVGFGAGGEGFVRLSYATSLENIERGCQRIASFVACL